MTKKFGKVRYMAMPLVAVAMLAAGCQPGTENNDAAGTPSGSAASPTAAPSPTAPPSNTEEVCAAVLEAFLDGTKKITDDSNKAIENGTGIAAQAKNLKATLRTMAAEVKPHAAEATDPEIGKVIREIAAKLEAGSKSSDVHGFLSKDLVPVGTRIDKECVA